MRTKEEALAKITELEKKLNLKTQEVEDGQRAMTKTVDDYEARLKVLVESNRQLVKGEQLIQTLRELLGAPAPTTGTGAASDQSVEASLRRILKMDGGNITLERVKRIISVKEEKRPMPMYSTLTPEGKIANLVVKGQLDSQKRLKQIEELVPQLPRIQVWKGIKKLMDDGVVVEGKEKDGHKVYMKDTDIEAEKKE